MAEKQQFKIQQIESWTVVCLPVKNLILRASKSLIKFNCHPRDFCNCSLNKAFCQFYRSCAISGSFN